MRNPNLAHDYLKRSRARLAALETLLKEKSWPDVVREAQEVVELALNAALRLLNIEVPRIHDVGQLLVDHRERLPEKLRPQAEDLAEISKQLRRDRELAFYGSEDLTPTEFYNQKDAKKAYEAARWTVDTVYDAFQKKKG